MYYIGNIDKAIKISLTEITASCKHPQEDHHNNSQQARTPSGQQQSGGNTDTRTIVLEIGR